MGTKSAFLYPGDFWLIQEPPPEVQAIPFANFFEETAAWTLGCGIHISVCQGNAVIFDFAGYPEALTQTTDGPNQFPKLIAATQSRVKVINAFSLCLHAARVELENFATDTFRLDHQDLFHLTGDDALSGMGGQGLRKLPTMTNGGYLRDYYKHGAVPKESIDLASSILDSIVSDGYEKSLDLTSLLNDSVTSFINHEFSSSLITAWTLCETVLQHHWLIYMTSRDGTSLNSSRRQKLTGRDFTASVVSEVLELAGVIDAETLSALDKARKARNAWMHSIKSPNYEDARDAIDLASRMLSGVLGREIRVIPPLGASGL
ncbi:hypothetical protein GUR47_26255 [Streptomyces tendae]|uniref:Apea-like HEPN domain-containing protein n=1 Tax=Streptomyces tendae TaxID=1932 RepID=A0A6B3QV85_STRTE|nr:hypothetical protein [Streptomyces tendae]NEV90131.1 hypothetical protein [Streptomyces tendae]